MADEPRRRKIAHLSYYDNGDGTVTVQGWQRRAGHRENINLLVPDMAAMDEVGDELLNQGLAVAIPESTEGADDGR